MEETARRSPNLKTCGEFVSNYVYRTNFCKFFIIYFREAQIMVRGKYTTSYLQLLKLACVILKIEVCNTGRSTWGRDPSLNFFIQKVHFVLFLLHFFRK